MLKIMIPDSMLLRLKTVKDKNLRKLSHTYSMLANVEEPYPNLSRRDNEVYDCLWDNMDLHLFFKYIKLNDKPMPPIITCIETSAGTELEPFFIIQIAY